jgi:hypothetical protein
MVATDGLARGAPAPKFFTGLRERVDRPLLADFVAGSLTRPGVLPRACAAPGDTGRDRTGKSTTSKGGTEWVA